MDDARRIPGDHHHTEPDEVGALLDAPTEAGIGHDSATGEFRRLLDDCVHCGFCLPTCPTYVLWGEEMDSPRGRIHLMDQVERGTALTETVVEHFDRCLGCMACVTSCPSGVQYDRLIETTRSRVEDAYPRGRAEKLLRAAIFALFPYPRRLRALRAPLRAYQRLPIGLGPLLERVSPTLAAMERLAPPATKRVRLPERVRAHGERRAVVGMLTGCVQGEFFPGVNAATARVLAMEGCDVVIPRRQGCCGALSLHSGRKAEAERFAARTAATFRDVDVVVVNSAGCGSAMKEYEEPACRAKVRDFAEFLTELGPRATRHPLNGLTVAYHDACHLAHAQGIRSQPRALLTDIPGLRITEIADPEICCGSAGVYNLLQPEAAADLGDRKAERVAATNADLLVAANPGCSLQIVQALARRGRRMPAAHTAEVLDASVRGIDKEALTSPY